MTQQIVCDGCGEPIDQTQPYYELNGSKVQMEGDPPALITVEPAKTMHYHEGHLAQDVLEPAPLPEPPPEEQPEQPPTDPDTHPEHPIVEPDEPEEDDDPYPGVDISSMTIQQALAWADDDADKLQWAIDQEVAGQNRAALVNQLENKLDRLSE